MVNLVHYLLLVKFDLPEMDSVHAIQSLTPEMYQLMREIHPRIKEIVPLTHVKHLPETDQPSHVMALPEMIQGTVVVIDNHQHSQQDRVIETHPMKSNKKIIRKLTVSGMLAMHKPSLNLLKIKSRLKHFDIHIRKRKHSS